MITFEIWNKFIRYDIFVKKRERESVREYYTIETYNKIYNKAYDNYWLLRKQFDKTILERKQQQQQKRKSLTNNKNTKPKNIKSTTLNKIHSI